MLCVAAAAAPALQEVEEFMQASGWAASQGGSGTVLAQPVCCPCAGRLDRSGWYQAACQLVLLAALRHALHAEHAAPRCRSTSRSSTGSVWTWCSTATPTPMSGKSLRGRGISACRLCMEQCCCSGHGGGLQQHGICGRRHWGWAIQPTALPCPDLASRVSSPAEPALHPPCLAAPSPCTTTR